MDCCAHVTRDTYHSHIRAWRGDRRRHTRKPTIVLEYSYIRLIYFLVHSLTSSSHMADVRASATCRRSCIGGTKDSSPHFFPSFDFLSIRYTMIRRLKIWLRPNTKREDITSLPCNAQKSPLNPSRHRK